MNEQTYTRPGIVTTIAVITLISGIVNVFWGAIMGFSMASSILLLCLAPIFVAQLAFGIYEIVYASKLLYSPPQPVQPSTTVAILEISTILVLNVFSLVVGILALVFYNDPQVKAYFASINGRAAMPAAVPAVEVLPPDRLGEPVVAESETPKPPRRTRARKSE